jgi:hypothetical protein
MAVVTFATRAAGVAMASAGAALGAVAAAMRGAASGTSELLRSMVLFPISCLLIN